MDDVSAVIRESSTGLMSHGVNDTEQCVGERHAGKALSVVHSIALFHIAVVGRNQIVLNHLDGEDGKRIRVIAVCSGNISFDRMGHSVHTGVSN